jgi:hypothetical protein
VQALSLFGKESKIVWRIITWVKKEIETMKPSDDKYGLREIKLDK